MKKFRFLQGALVLLLCSTVPVEAQGEGPAAAVAADVISAILDGEAGDAAWVELEAALVGVSAEVGTPEADSVVPAGTGASLDRAVQAARAFGDEILLRASGIEWTPDVVAAFAMALLLVVALTATVVGLTRRARGRPPRGGRRPSRNDVVRLPARGARRGRTVRLSRDAERLAARLRTRSAA